MILNANSDTNGAHIPVAHHNLQVRCHRVVPAIRERSINHRHVYTKADSRRTRTVHSAPVVSNTTLVILNINSIIFNAKMTNSKRTGIPPEFSKKKSSTYLKIAKQSVGFSIENHQFYLRFQNNRPVFNRTPSVFRGDSPQSLHFQSTTRKTQDIYTAITPASPGPETRRMTA